MGTSRRPAVFQEFAHLGRAAGVRFRIGLCQPASRFLEDEYSVLGKASATRSIDMPSKKTCTLSFRGSVARLFEVRTPPPGKLGSPSVYTFQSHREGVARHTFGHAFTEDSGQPDETEPTTPCSTNVILIGRLGQNAESGTAQTTASTSSSPSPHKRAGAITRASPTPHRMASRRCLAGLEQVPPDAPVRSAPHSVKAPSCIARSRQKGS